MSVATAGSPQGEHVKQGKPKRASVSVDDEASKQSAHRLHSLDPLRPSFISGIASLLDLSGDAVAEEVATRRVRVIVATPERAIANAWWSVGDSLRFLLPTSEGHTDSDE